jgi:hypothetical protein
VGITFLLLLQKELVYLETEYRDIVKLSIGTHLVQKEQQSGGRLETFMLDVKISEKTLKEVQLLERNSKAHRTSISKSIRSLEIKER